MIFKTLQIDNFIKKTDKNIKAILVYGSNDGLILDSIKRLARSVCADLNDAFQVADISGESVLEDFGKLVAEYNAQSLMGGRRVIIVREISDRLSKDIRKMLDESKSDNLLLMYATDLNKKSALVKLAESSNDMAGYACYDDKNEDIIHVLRATGLTFDSAAIQLLCSRLSNDRMINLSEIEKLKTYMGDAKNVTLDIVAKVISDQSNSSSEDICYAVMNGNKAGAEKLFEKYLDEGNEAVSLVKSMEYHVMKLLLCAAGLERGESEDEALKRLVPKLMFYREDDFKMQLRKWRKDKLLSALEVLYDVEKDCKTTGMPEEDIVSRMLLRMAGAANR
ncbi:MAG: DNA polymerase III subunit delta [Alphaproteobacteria bacterium]|nr:DNA polymerase III subunit delta [Alphaproteobacteria bacterium]